MEIYKKNWFCMNQLSTKSTTIERNVLFCNISALISFRVVKVLRGQGSKTGQLLDLFIQIRFRTK